MRIKYKTDDMSDVNRNHSKGLRRLDGLQTSPVLLAVDLGGSHPQTAQSLHSSPLNRRRSIPTNS